MKLIDSIVTVGKSLQSALTKCDKLHLDVLHALAGDGDGKRPVSVWFATFVQFISQTYEWPTDKNGEPVGYRTVMRNAGKYSTQVVACAHYFNRFQAYLNGKSLVQVVKADSKGKRSSKGNVVTADDVLKKLQAVLMLAPEGKREAVAKHLMQVAKQGFGIANADFSGIIKR